MTSRLAHRLARLEARCSSTTQESCCPTTLDDGLAWSAYIPHQPTPKQRQFLALSIRRLPCPPDGSVDFLVRKITFIEWWREKEYLSY